MVRVGEKFENPRTGAIMEIARAPGEGERVLELRRTMKPGTGKTIAHVHRDYVERFVVEAGEALARIDRRERRLGPGDELEIQIGQRHVNPYNVSTSDLVMRHVFEPASDFALSYAETLGHLMRAGATDKQGEVPVLAAFAIGHATNSRTYAAGIPDGFQRSLVFPLGAALGRLRGYDLHLAHAGNRGS